MIRHKTYSDSMIAGPVTRKSGAGFSPEPDEPDGRPAETRMNRIAKRAHEIYEARGGEHGRAIDHWLQAEAEIDAESSDS